MDGLSVTDMLIRFLLGGGAVVASTIIAKTLGAKIGGIFAAFPAVFIAALLSLRLDLEGKELINQSIILSQGAFVGMLINIVCALLVVYFCMKLDWKRGLTQSIAVWFVISLAYVMITS